MENNPTTHNRNWSFLPTKEQLEFFRAIKSQGCVPNDWLREAIFEKITLEGGVKEPAQKWVSGLVEMATKVGFVCHPEHSALLHGFVREGGNLSAWLRYAIAEKRERDVVLKIPGKSRRPPRQKRPSGIHWGFNVTQSQADFMANMRAMGGHPADWLREAITEKLSLEGGMLPPQKKMAGKPVKLVSTTIPTEQDQLFQQYKKRYSSVSEWARWAIEEKMGRQDPSWEPSMIKTKPGPRPPKTTRKRIEGGVKSLTVSFTKAHRQYLRRRKADGENPSRVVRAAMDMYLQAQELKVV